MKHCPYLCAILLLITGIVAYPASSALSVDRVSLSSMGAEGNGDAWGNPSLSSDGRFIVFDISATNTSLGSANGFANVVVHDHQSHSTEVASLTNSGEPANGDSWFGSICPDGQYVAFLSYASNLVDRDTNQALDVFLRDRAAGKTEMISVSSAGEPGNRESSYMLFVAISAGGRFVAFAAEANNLAPDDTNYVSDIFVRDRLKGVTERVSINSAGEQANNESVCAAISADGRYVAFYSTASNLVANDTNGKWDAFVRDRLAGTTERVSIGTSGQEGNGNSGYMEAVSISADGRFVAFMSAASNLVADDTNSSWDVFLRDRQNGTTELISKSSTGLLGNGESMFPSVSNDGRFVVFESKATNLVPDDTNLAQDVFLRDRLLQTTTRLSENNLGRQSNRDSNSATISGDGKCIVFISQGDNLAAVDNNQKWDVFFCERSSEHLISVSAQGPTTNIASAGAASLSASFSDNLGHQVVSWHWDDNSAGGRFSPNADVPNPTWTAPGNLGTEAVAHALTVTAVCGGPPASFSKVSVYLWEDPRRYQLAVVADPSTGGTVAGAGEYLPGTNVPVSASPAAGWLFAGWEGAVADTDSSVTSVLMEADRSATAKFTRIQCSLSASAEPTQGGTVIGAGKYDFGALASVAAAANAGWLFSGWSGDLAGNSNPTNLVMGGNKSVVAYFVKARENPSAADVPSGVSADSGGGGVEGTTVTSANLLTGGEILVGDVSPALSDNNQNGNTDDWGEFGDGQLAVDDTSFIINCWATPESAPLSGTARFFAADCYPTTAGDGFISWGDVIASFDAVANQQVELPWRLFAGTAANSAPQDLGQRFAAPDAPSLEFASVSGAPGATLRIPVRLNLHSLQADRLGFVAAVSQQAPAVEITGFTPANGMLDPMIMPLSPGILSVVWLEPLATPLSNSIYLGDLVVHIADSAPAGQSFALQLKAGGLSLAGQELEQKLLPLAESWISTTNR